MKITNELAIGVAAAALLALTACSTSTSNEGGQSNAATSTSASPSAPEPHNQVDVMFAQHMIQHHQQAIEMSDIIIAKGGIDDRVVDMANQIKAAQGPEIEEMRSWLRDWDQPTTMPMMPGMATPSQSATPSQTPDPHHTGTSTPAETTSAMPGSSAMPGMPNSMMPSGTLMPGMDGMMGMMSPQDMAALQNAQGVEAAKLFLTQMIQHHQGAITMAQHVIEGGQYPPMKELARSIVTSQQQEIATMETILGSL